MKEHIIPIIDLKNTSDELRINCKLQICVECGHTNLDKFEFGLSCEFCGTLFVFSEKRNSTVKRGCNFDVCYS